MTWIKLNDNVPRHPKIAGLSDRGFRVWITGLCYASEFLTDGVLPAVFLTTVHPKVRDELIAAGLWSCTAGTTGGTTTVHDYLEHQSSRATVLHERRRNRARRTGDVPKKYRDQRSENRGTEVPPISPSDEGDSNRVIRRHLKQAEKILQSWMGYCKHLPECGTQVECLKVIARELAQKEKAS
jgi:hypothetical protein